MTTVLLDRCGCITETGECEGRVLYTAELGGITEGDCEKCKAPFALPTAQVSPQVRRARLLEHAALPGQFAAKRFVEDEHNRPALNAIRSWLDCWTSGEAKDLMPAPALWGLAGRGKTHLLAAVCRRLVDRDVSVRFASARRLLRAFQDFDGEARDMWRKATTVPVLALDDLGAQQQTDWRLDQLADLINERYDAERPVLLATNFAPSSWRDMFDERTASRLRGMTFPVELGGPDRRQPDGSSQ